ncbi:MAG: immunoglobulin domain-containing protein, partial [Verrucomicrobiota bacterium]
MTKHMNFQRRWLLLIVTLLAGFTLPAADEVYITEFVASNSTGLKDEDGDQGDWIEIFNAGTNTVDLTSWYLTDNASKPTKWAFPATNIIAGQYMIIYASGKNRRTPGAPLHTSFKLGASGGYLGLIRSDLSIANQYSPAYPPQATDISYGWTQTAATNMLVSRGTALKYRVPTNAFEDPFWKDPSYDVSSWLNGTNALGFNAATNTNTLWLLIADSQADFAGNQGSNNWYYGYYLKGTDTVTPGFQTNDLVIFPWTSSYWSAYNYWTGTNWDYYTSSNPYDLIANLLWMPNGTNNTAASSEHWVGRRYIVESNGVLKLDWWLAKKDVVGYRSQPVTANANDYITLSGSTLKNNDLVRFNATIMPGGLTAGTWYYAVLFSGTSFKVGLTPNASPNNTNFIDITSAGSGVTLDTADSGVTGYLYRNGTMIASNSIAYNDTIGVSNTLFLSNAVAGEKIDFLLSPQGTDGANNDTGDLSYGRLQVYLATTFTNQYNTDIRTNMMGSNTTVYARIPFTVANPATLDGLFLRMRYADGFVAYINGQEVARRNAPANSGGGVIANSTNDWSGDGLQGANNWFYGYYDQTGDINGIYNPNTDFRFDNDSWFFTGTNFVLGLDDPPYTMISSNVWAPDGSDNGLDINWPIRRWVSPVSGVVTARVFCAKANSGGSGVTFRFFHNGIQLCNQSLAGTDLTGFTTNILVPGVEIGDKLDFALDPTGTDGTTAGTSDRTYFGVSITQQSLGDPGYNSAATASATTDQTLTGEIFDLNNYRGFVMAGSNLLSIQGLSQNLSPPDFLLSAELYSLTATVKTNQGMYFAGPTPGNINSVGTTNLGPLIVDPAFAPAVPMTSQAITVTTRIVPTFGAVSNITLTYRVMFFSETNVLMNDSGTNGDLVAGDGIYTGLIPANIATTNGTMLRWYVQSRDTNNLTMRSPPYPDPYGSPQYYGTVCMNSNINSKLTVFHWFIQTPTAAENESGARSSFYYKGQFFDNVGVTLHGQSSGGFPKKSYNFNLNHGDKLALDSPNTKLGDFCLLTTWADRSYMRIPMAYDLYTMVGSPANFSFPIRLHQNGSFFSVTTFSEQGNEDFLTRIGFDPNGALYKMYNNLSSVTTNEKKSRKWEPFYDLQALINGVTQSDVNARVAYVYDNLNLPEIISFIASKAMNADHDCCHKNHYMYRDSDGSGEWYAIPWDMDLSFGHMYTGANGGYFDDTIYTNVAAFIGNGQTALGVIYSDATLRSLVNRRIRTMMDTLLQPIGTPTNTDILRGMMNSYAALVADDVALDRAKWKGAAWTAPTSGPANPDSGTNPSTGPFTNELSRLQDYFLPNRRQFMFYNRVVAGELPATAQATNLVLLFGAIDYNPISHNQAEEYIELINPNNCNVDISGWEIKGGVSFHFKPGTVIPTNSSIFVSPATKSFRSRAVSPRGGERRLVVGPYSGQLSARGESLALVTDFGWTNATVATPSTPSLAQQYLRVTEIMYNPASGGAYAAGEYEYVELKNISTSATLDLTDVKITNAVDFNFTGSAITNLGPGQRVLVVRNLAAFVSRYGPGLPVAGQYSGALNNAGDRVQLLDSDNEQILDFSYNNSWYPLTDGLGFSLVVVNENADPSAWNNQSQWRASGRVNGSPGTDDPAPYVISPVLVNECLAHTDLPDMDSMELYNPNTNAVDIGGWYITDDFYNPKKFMIPTGTVIGAGCYLVYTTNDFIRGGTNIAFSATGDDVYLFGTDTNRDLTGYYHGYTFGASHNGVSFGRIVTTAGDDDFMPQLTKTVGTNNSGPRVGPIVINEVMYNPPNLTTYDPPSSYIELLNTAATNYPLFTLAEPTNAWHIRNAVDYDFPTNVWLQPGQTLLVVGFDPVTNTYALNAFRSRYGTPTNALIFGPWQGTLGNHDQTIHLNEPDLADTNTVPYVTIEKVHYLDTYPWPVVAGGMGASLKRMNTSGYGNEPTNWTSAMPTPGTNSVSGQVPQITMQPQGQAILPGANYTLSITATSSPPMVCQWILNNVAIPNATNYTLALTNVQHAQSGSYQAAVMNAYGAALSIPAMVWIQAPIIITGQPASRTNFPYQTITFTPIHMGDDPLYHWRLNGTNIAGATNLTLTLTNLQVSDSGNYQVVISNQLSAITSSIAALTVSQRPVILTQPQSQPYSPGTNVTFSVMATSSTTLHYQWYFTNSLVNASTNSTLQITNAQIQNLGAYFVVVTDDFGSVTSTPATLAYQVLPSFYPPAQPTNLVVYVNNPAIYAASVVGTLPLTWQWQMGGFSIFTNIVSLDTNAPPLFSSAQFTNANVYKLRATNQYSSGGSGWSPAIYLTVIAPLTNQVADPGSNATFTLVASTYYGATTNANYILKYRWWFNGTNLLANQTNATLTITNAQITNTGNYTVIGTNYYQTIVSQMATLTVGTIPPAISSDPVSTTNLVGTPAGFSVTVFGTPPLYYQWYFNSGLVSNATNSLLQITNVQLTNAGAYKVIVTNAYGRATSQVATLTVTGMPPQIVTSPLSQATIQGSNVTFTSLASGSEPLFYQWQLNNANLSGANSASYTIAAVQMSQAGAYTVVVTNAFGSATSTVATLSVWSVPVIGTPPQSRTNLAGTTASFSVAASGLPTPWYQWWYNGTTLLDQTNTSLTLTNVQTTNTGNYSVVVTNMAGTVTSVVAVLSVWSAPAMVTQPQSQTNLAGTNASFTVIADGVPEIGYQWWYKSVASNQWSVISVGTNSLLSISNCQLSNAGNYTVVATNLVGSVTSAVAVLTVWQPPVIATQPQSQTNLVDTTASFSVDANGVPAPWYQWWCNGAALLNQTNITLTLTNVQTTHAGNYSVVVTNTLGSVTSAVAGLVIGTSPTITQQPVGQSVYAGQNASFTVGASGVGLLTYQWYGNDALFSGQTNTTLTLTNVQAAQEGGYYVVVSNPYGSTTGSVALLALRILPPSSAPGYFYFANSSGSRIFHPTDTAG